MDAEEIKKSDFLDIVFNGRNKAYGAYELRRSYAKRLTMALVGVAIGTAVIAGAVILSQKLKKDAPEEKFVQTEISLEEVKAPEEEKPIEPPPPPPPKQEPPPQVEMKQFTPPVIKKDEEVPDEQTMKSQEELVKSDVQISIADVKGTNEETGVDIATLQEHKVIVQEEVVEEKVFEIVEQPPSFPGGEAAMYEWLSKNINYPVIAQENNIQGRVTCQFVVGRNGEIEDVRVVRGVDASLDKEAIRVIRSMPKWIPGKQGGNAVKVRYTLPVQFKLQ